MYYILLQFKYLLQITAPYGFVTNRVKKVIKIMAGVTNFGFITNYVITWEMCYMPVLSLRKKMIVKLAFFFVKTLGHVLRLL